MQHTWGEEKCIQGFDGETTWERPGRRWEGNIKMDRREVGLAGMDWIDLAEDRERWWAIVNAVMNLRVP